ncbi:allophanate hydrolase [Aquincola sp. J276]|uniref:allophanate hydrolase n=1 Tax=Aquincola sp. J276 TaxID=2898432 RepID=UPI002150F983|nr:allophanate hydrolase [Aquincola sp. J276]MCR5868778.1 allophanate hydrolase [Aquincola sp. J276]
MNEHPPLTLNDWRRAYAAGATPSVLLATLAQRLQASPAAAWITRASAAQLQAQADALEARRAAAGGDLQAMPLYGVPFAVKDNIDIEDVDTTAACPAFAYRAGSSAQAVQQLLAAGAVWVGKTNLDQFATGLVGTRSPYGQPASTFDATRVSGGSSSGSAVVVSRGDVVFSLGTDTAGSGRVPAGFNNIVGLKPTPGRVSTAGVVPACRSLDCISVFALTADDTAEVLAVMEGPDEADAYSRFQPGAAQLPARLRIGVPAAVVLDAAYDDAWARALALARQQGHELVALDFGPLHKVAALLYGGPWVAERHAAVQPLLDSHPEAFDPTVRTVIEQALRMSATDAFRGQYALRAAQQQAARLWQQVDVLLVPTAPGHPTFEQLQADPIGANARLGTYTNFVNLLGWAAIALPAGFTAQGLPFGVTFIAPGGTDAALARLGSAWQAATALPLGATDAPCPAPGTPLRRPATEAVLPIAVVGAHLSGMPLNGQLTERGATLREATRTAPLYRLFALPGTTPPKPGLQRVAEGGAAIAVEVWDMPLHQVGSFLALIPPPLGLGSLQLADGRVVHGFICEGHALAGATDVTRFGGWRAYVTDLKARGA